MSELIVRKFGGSSLASAQQFKQVKAIVMACDQPQAIVVSAPGKGDGYDVKVTDLLYLLHEHLKYDINYNGILSQIEERYLAIKKALNLQYDVMGYFDDLKKTLAQKVHRDWLVSRGEYLCGALLSEYLGYGFLDPANHLYVGYDKQFDEVNTKQHMKHVSIDNGLVMPGFYATTPHGEITLLARGGSDTSGGMLAVALNASLYENYTDVSGVYVTDPSIVKEAKTIEHLSYSEIKELSYRGAKLLHQEAITPVSKAHIPIVIKNTNDPAFKGTRISDVFKDNGHVVTAISGKKDFTVFNIAKKGDYHKTNVLQHILTVFMQHDIDIEHIPSGIDSFSVIVASETVESVKLVLLKQLNELEGIDSIDVEENLALIAVVGKNMAKTTGVAGTLFGALGKEKINVKVIAQSSTELSVIVGVDEPDYQRAIQTIYYAFFK